MRTQRGVSLVEAIVAMAVMAFGMLAIVGLQATMRLNSDIAKQRGEAVRIAQEAIEDWRAFSVIDTVGGRLAYADIGTAAPAVVNGYTTNTEYTLTLTVADAPVVGLKAVRASVAWMDRAGQNQTVALSSLIARADPALSGVLSLAASGAPVRQPMGRHPGIPVKAKDLGDGTSAFKPPGANGDTVAWVFNNASGVITSVCVVSAMIPTSDLELADVTADCLDQPSLAISGFVRFSLGNPANASAPSGTQIDLGVLALAAGVEFANGECFAEAVQSPPLTYTAYYCRVPRSADSTWTGRTELGPPLDLTLYDVCRYTGVTGENADHPAVYVHLDQSIGSQNFLVVTQGVTCPSPATAPHQPP